ncbi:MAG: hypothetical protein FJ214_04720 [Ignavibacteria bacterium]|nr:hypothetical protein [Ignavibacteria bacterium]
MGKLKRIQKEVAKSSVSPFKNYWSTNNYFILLIGILTIMFGYFLMGQGNWDSISSLSISPMILVVAYIIIVPLSIFHKKNLHKDKNVSS